MSFGVCAGGLAEGRRRVAIKFIWLAILVFSACLAPAHRAAAKPLPASLVVDANTGDVLHEHNADAPRYPASLTKMMTLYILFEEMNAKRVSLSTKFEVSAKAASMQPSKLNLKPGQTILVRDAILALVTKSANDVAATIAENLAGTEQKFARRMTATAKSIGMSRTRFMNASGLPDTKQKTTARDMYRLAVALQTRFPGYYRYFKTRAFKYHGHTYRNHNRLLGQLKGTDGIKTGYTRASGFNLVTSVHRGKKHLIGVVIGGRSGRARNRKMISLITKALPRAATRRTTPRPQVVAAANPTMPVPLPKPASISPIIAVSPVPILMSRNGVLPRPVAPPKSDQLAANVPAATAPPGYQVRPAGEARNVSKPVVLVSLPDETLPVRAGIGNEASGDAVDAALSRRLKASWIIQIGAYSSEDAARARLEEANAKNISYLRGKTAIAMAAPAGGSTIYRARFAGFDNKRVAFAACKQLQRRAIRCYPIAPN